MRKSLLDGFLTATSPIGVVLFVLVSHPVSVAAADLDPAAAVIATNRIADHIRVLASDEFEGRGPATRGEELTVEYLTRQFRQLGLKPGAPDGSFTQLVPLAGSAAQATISFTVGGRTMPLAFPGECVIASRHFTNQVEVRESEVVFVGYGIRAPEYGWDDFKGVDVRGKTLVFLVNDPPIPDPATPGQLDARMFRGKAMTYYGRWTYKYEIAAEKGAAAALIVHETGPAGYPWLVVVGSWSRENFELQTPDRNLGRAPVEGWIHLDQARALVQAGGHDFDRLKAAALRSDFKPVPLGAKATFTLRNTLRQVPSRNVIARLEGADPRLKEECVLYTAHWDHLGRNASLEGDTIYNGARDNATGVAALLEIARAFTQTKIRPPRTVLFAAVTAEEQGLLGAKYYAQHPSIPLHRTLANINMDSMNQWGRTLDVNVIGLGLTTLDDLLERAARVQGRRLTPDAAPEMGLYYRSDHFEFAKLGVPGLYVGSGVELRGRDPGFGMTKGGEYIQRDYHKVSDDMKPDWDLSGLVEDGQLLFQVGLEVARGAEYPEWKTGAEFKAIREQSLRGGSRQR